MSSSAVTQKTAKEHQQVAKPSAGGLAREEKEASASANASAGLNLNVFGALSGVFSGKSSKQQNQDGSSYEESEQRIAGKGAGAGNMTAVGQANAETKGREMREQIMARQ